MEDLQGQSGSQDGTGSADHDLPYKFGWKPRSVVPFPFNTRQFAKLLMLRSRVESGLSCTDDLAAA